MLPKVHVRPKGPPFGFFFGTMRLFSKVFEIYQRVPPWIFLKFSVCRKRWMSLNGLFLSFSALCDLKNTFFRKKIKNFFLKKIFFPNFSNSCSLNIFEPKIWRRLGTFPSCWYLLIHTFPNGSYFWSFFVVELSIREHTSHFFCNRKNCKTKFDILISKIRCSFVSPNCMRCLFVWSLNRFRRQSKIQLKIEFRKGLFVQRYLKCLPCMQIQLFFVDY